jgi:hypothetical protein
MSIKGHSFFFHYSTDGGRKAKKVCLIIGILILFEYNNIVKRSARTGRNPLTGKPLKIAAKRVPKFSAGKRLKALVVK